MNRNERPFRPLPWRLSSAAWCASLGSVRVALRVNRAHRQGKIEAPVFSVLGTFGASPWNCLLIRPPFRGRTNWHQASEKTGSRAGVRSNRPSTYRYSDNESPLHA